MNYRFINSLFSLLHNVTFLCKLRRIHVIARIGIHTCCYSGQREHFRWNLGHFTDSSRNGVSEGALGSSLGGSFLVPRITYFDGFGQGGSET